MEYQKTLAVLWTAEQLVIGKPVDWPAQPGLRAYADTVLGGPWLVMAGARMLFKRLLWVLAAGLTFTLFLLLFEGGGISQVIGPAFILALAVVYFSMPSRSLTATVNAKNVSYVRDFILRTTANDQELKRLHDGLMIVRTHTLAKLSRFSVLAGVAWGVLFWYVGTHALAPGLSAEAVGRGISNGMVGALVFIGVLLAGTCHASAVRSVCQTLEFALLEAKAVDRSSRASSN